MIGVTGDLRGASIDLQHRLLVDELRLDVVELLADPLAGVRFAFQAPAAHRPAAEREIQAGLLELGEHRLFDLIERQGASGDPVLRLLEDARHLADAVRADTPARPRIG